MITKKPDWLKIRIIRTAEFAQVEEIINRLSLNTVCVEANCPNRMECFCKKTATFMILGRKCTRNCTFCNVEKNIPDIICNEEPIHVAEAVKELGLKHVVITSVTRDDLPDGGAEHFAHTITKIRESSPDIGIEVLIPDFKGDLSSLMKVIKAKPDIINHNIETVPRLYNEVRPMANYDRSLQLLKRVKNSDVNIFTKSGIMIGLGETEDEVIQVFEDLRKSECDFLTVGQYLAPSKKHHPVIEYKHPNIFAKYKIIAENMGFKYVTSGPFVRSSYQAEKFIEKNT